MLLPQRSIFSLFSFYPMNQPQTALAPRPLPLFTAEPGLSWLKNDPTMQQPDAFVGLTIYELSGYAPMDRSFPAGCSFAMKRVHSCDELTEGVYFAQQAAGRFASSTSHQVQFGRFAGLDESSNPRAQARRAKRGFVHFELQADVLPDAPGDYLLRSDGSQTVFMDFNSRAFELWRVTHYVSLPTWALGSLSLRAEVAGTTPDQARWLNEERLIETDAAGEFSARVLGGFPEPDCRALLSGAEEKDFNCLWNSLPTLRPSEAKKRRSGAVAITWRSSGPNFKSVSHTEYHRREDAALLMDWLQNLSDIRRAEARAVHHGQAVADAAKGIRTARKAASYAQQELQELQELQQAKSTSRQQLTQAA